MKSTIHAGPRIAGVLALLVIGCAPVADVNYDYSYSANNDKGPFSYTAQPAYVNGGFGSYSLGYPVYTSPDITVVPEWVTAPNRYSDNYIGNYRVTGTGYNRNTELWQP